MQSPQDLEAVLRQFVADARAADPDVDLVLGRIPQPWIDKVPAFNSRVDALAAELTTADSRIVSAQTDAGLVRSEDTWDTFHPNARGDVKIAAAIADALSILGIGPPAERPLPEVPRGPRIKPVLTATSTLRDLHLMWLRSPGAQESEVLVRDMTTGEGWHQVLAHLTGSTYDLTGLPAWHRFQVQVVPTKWNWRALEDAWSNVVDVQVVEDRLDRPAAMATATAEGVATVGWAAVPGATSYAVQWRRADQSGAWPGAVSVPGTAATVTGLANRAGYAFRVRAERGALVGDWSDETAATVPALAAVTGARVTRAARALKARARPIAFATSYTLSATAAPSCRKAPRSRRFEVVAAGLTTTVKRFRLTGRAVGCVGWPCGVVSRVTWARPPRRACGCPTDPHVPNARRPGSSRCRVCVVAVKEWLCSPRDRRDEVGVFEVGDRGTLGAPAVGDDTAHGVRAEDRGDRQKDQ